MPRCTGSAAQLHVECWTRIGVQNAGVIIQAHSEKVCPVLYDSLRHNNCQSELLSCTCSSTFLDGDHWLCKFFPCFQQFFLVILYVSMSSNEQKCWYFVQQAWRKWNVPSRHNTFAVGQPEWIDLLHVCWFTGVCMLHKYRLEFYTSECHVCFFLNLYLYFVYFDASFCNRNGFSRYCLKKFLRE